MLLVRNKKGHELSQEHHTKFVKKCEEYIGGLKKDGRPIAAQPLVCEGSIVSGSTGKWKETSLADEVQVGYYHILAKDLDEAR